MADLTSFGLERRHLEEGLSDAFTWTNPTIIDRLLRVGALTHRHDNHAALTDPAGVPVVDTVAVGGSIPADTSVYVTYTLVDADGGETMSAPAAIITTSAGLPNPEAAPGASVDYTGGALLAGAYYYAVTVVDGSGGESTLGPPVAITVDPGHATAKIVLTGLDAILAATGGTEWRLWRAQGGGSWDQLTQGATATVTDDGSFTPDCSVSPPQTTTTHSTNRIHVTVPGPLEAGAVSFNLYISLDGSFSSPALVANHPAADAGTVITLNDLTTSEGAPPPASTSLPGAAQIDPDTELVDWHWKRPVATVAGLPALGNAAGDVRVVTASGHWYVWDGAAWHPKPAQQIIDAANTLMALRSRLKFTGAGVVVTDDAANDQTVIDIAGGGGGGGTPTYPLGTEVQWTDDQGAVRARIIGEDGFNWNDPVEDNFTAGGNANLGSGYQRDVSGTGRLYNNDTLADTYIYLEPALADAVQLARQFEILIDAGWDHLGITIGTGGNGLYAYIDKASGELRIATRTAGGALTTIASAGAVQGIVVPTTTHTYELQFSKLDHHLSAALFNTDGGVYTQVGPTVEVDIPNALRATYGGGSTLHYGFADGDNTVASWQSDYLTHTTTSSVVKQIRANVVDALGNQVDRVLLDENGRLDMPTVGATRTLDEVVMSTTFGANWGVPATGQLAGVFKDLSQLLHWVGKLVKSGGVAPVAGEVMATIANGNYFGSAWYSELFFPVVTGDDDGHQLGMVSFAQNAGATGIEIRWQDGKATAPATKHPFILLNGVHFP